MKRWLLLPVLLFQLSAPAHSTELTPLKVEVKKEGDKFQLYRGGNPYYINGAGGYSDFKRLKEYGGNSVRIWHSEEAQQTLDEAHALGLTVTIGLNMQLERHGFNYSNKEAVKKQLDYLKEQVVKYKDHPALLMWGVGNEVDQFANNMEVWDAVNELSKFIHEVDPNHPTTTMLAGVPRRHVKEIVARCPNLDVLGINAFSDIPNVRKKVEDAGWKGPYIIGEWGATGYWELGRTEWGAFIEETSTVKAERCLERFEKGIKENTDKCLGSYAFYWGYKQARTHTLLSLMLETGEEIAVIDALQYVWTGKWPGNRAPAVTPITIDKRGAEKSLYFKPGSQHIARIEAKDADNDKLVYKWELYLESKERKEGGDREEKPKMVDGVTVKDEGAQMTFMAPQAVGAYRLFVYVYDGKNNVATANFPFYVLK